MMHPSPKAKRRTTQQEAVDEAEVALIVDVEEAEVPPEVVAGVEECDLMVLYVPDCFPVTHLLNPIRSRCQ